MDGAVACMFSRALKSLHTAIVTANAGSGDAAAGPVSVESLKAETGNATEAGGRKKRGGAAIGAGVAPKVLAQWVVKATAALEGARARRFVHQLLTWPGVEGAIAEAGGWETTENLAGGWVGCARFAAT